MKRTYFGWAVLMRWNGPKKPPYMMGRYYLAPTGHLPSMIGHHYAVFPTRRAAYDGIMGRGERKDMSVHRVKVTIQVVRSAAILSERRKRKGKR